MITESRLGAEVESLAVSAYTIPTDEPESDGTFEWDSTTIVVVEARGEIIAQSVKGKLREFVNR